MQKKILPRNNIKIGLATPRFTGSLDLSSNLSRTYILNLVFISKLIKSACNGNRLLVFGNSSTLLLVNS